MVALRSRACACACLPCAVSYFSYITSSMRDADTIRNAAALFHWQL